MNYAEGYPIVETPAFSERFVKVPNSYSGFYECVVCGKRGQPPLRENQRWWSSSHSEHVRCTCGKVMMTKGLPMHRTHMARNGNPCPPLNRMVKPPKPSKLQKIVMLRLFNGVSNLAYGGRGSHYQQRKAKELIQLIQNFKEDNPEQ